MKKEKILTSNAFLIMLQGVCGTFWELIKYFEYRSRGFITSNQIKDSSSTDQKNYINFINNYLETIKKWATESMIQIKSNVNNKEYLFERKLMKYIIRDIPSIIKNLKSVKDPTVIKNFYDVLEDTMKSGLLENRNNECYPNLLQSIRSFTGYLENIEIRRFWRGQTAWFSEWSKSYPNNLIEIQVLQ